MFKLLCFRLKNFGYRHKSYWLQFSIPKISIKCLPVLLVTLGIYFSSNQNFSNGSSFIAAIVNDEVISVHDLQSRINFVVFSSKLPNKKSTVDSIKFQILQLLIVDRLKLQEAKRQNILITSEMINNVIKGLEKRNKMKAGELIENLIRNKIDPNTFKKQLEARLAWRQIIRQSFLKSGGVSEKDIDDQIQQIKIGEGKPEYNISEIFISSNMETAKTSPKQVSDKIRNQIKDGAKFNWLARTFSQSPSASKGGGLGWVRSNQLDETLFSVVSKMKINQISRPVKVAGGFYLIKLNDKRLGQGINLGETIVSMEQIFLPLKKKQTKQDLEVQINLAKAVFQTAENCDDMKKYRKDIGNLQPTKLENIKVKDLNRLIRKYALSLPLKSPSKPIMTKSGVLLLMVCQRRFMDDDKAFRNTIKAKLSEERAKLISKRKLINLRRSSFIELRK